MAPETAASLWQPTDLESVPTQALRTMAKIAGHAAEMAETLGLCADAESYRDTERVLDDEARSRDPSIFDRLALDAWQEGLSMQEVARRLLQARPILDGPLPPISIAR